AARAIVATLQAQHEAAGQRAQSDDDEHGRPRLELEHEAHDHGGEPGGHVHERQRLVERLTQPHGISAEEACTRLLAYYAGAKSPTRRSRGDESLPSREREEPNRSCRHAAARPSARRRDVTSACASSSTPAMPPAGRTAEPASSAATRAVRARRGRARAVARRAYALRSDRGEDVRSPPRSSCRRTT